MNIKSGQALAVLAAVLMLVVGSVGASVAEGRSSGQSGSRYEQFVGKVARLLGAKPGEVGQAMAEAQRELVDEAVARGEVSPEKARQRKARIGEGGGAIFGGGPAVKGVVTAKRGDALTLWTRKGERQVRVARDTAVRVKGRTGAASEIQVGARLLVKGGADAKGVVTAERVRVLPVRGYAKGKARNVVPEAARFLGTTPEQLRAKLRAGESLAEIAGAAKTPALIDRLVASANARADAALAGGKIDADRAAKLKEKARERVTKLVHRVRKA